MAEGSFLAARTAIDGLLARRPSGRTLEVARRFEEVLDLDPSSLPALEALQRSVESGADEEARAILDRLMLRRPRGRLLEILEAYRRILDGRGLVSGLRLRLEYRPEPEAPQAGGSGEKRSVAAPRDARFAHLFLVAESRAAGPIDLDPGPATLFVTRSTVDRKGMEDDAVETHTFPALKSLRIEAGKQAEVSLARFFLAPPEKGLASRLRFEIDLRSGMARIETMRSGSSGSSRRSEGSREVPAMRLRASETEVCALDPSLAALPAATPEELLALVEGKTNIDLVGALSVALRLPPGERGRTLDLLTPIVVKVPVGVVQSLAPTLRWIAVTAEPGGDADAWRAWLRQRDGRKTKERPRLVLPDRAPEVREPARPD
jgi:hypothetical protein